MNEELIFSRLQVALESANVPYMLTGSFASSLHGASRTNQDIDIIINPSHEEMVALLDQFSPTEFDVNRKTAITSLEERGQFNVIDYSTGWKIDFIIRKARDFSIEEFERRTSRDLFGIPFQVVSAEDSILSKLERA